MSTATIILFCALFFALLLLGIGCNLLLSKVERLERRISYDEERFIELEKKIKELEDNNPYKRSKQ